MTIYEKALEWIRNGDIVGLGSGRASTAFIHLLGDKVKAGLKIQGVPTSEDSASLARKLNIPIISLEQASGKISCAVDGADEVDPSLNLIKGYGRALVREKIIAASAKKFIILVGQEKMVTRIGDRGKLPVETVPFGVPLVQQKLLEIGIESSLWNKNGDPAFSDNGNSILDCKIGPQENPRELQNRIRNIPGVVDTGLFLAMADVVLVGDDTFKLTRELKRS